MRFLTLPEVLELQQRVVAASGGAVGVRDLGSVASAIAQPEMVFDGKELYPSLEEKAAALCYSLVMNHPFVDGNKRIGHAAMEVFLILNGFDLVASVDDSEKAILNLAASKSSREELVAWVKSHLRPRS